jgi:selenocysteine lyase/cysteine desulfurase
MPVRRIVELCRSNGIVAVVDGAHPPGMTRVDIAALGPDFYASSPHKWLLAPQGTGFLWMGEEWRTRLWPTLASGGWDDTSLGAHRFNHLGTLDESRLAGLEAALAFQQAIGIDRIETRVRQLRRHLLDRLSTVSGIDIVSVADDTRAAGMVSFRVPGIESLEVQRRLSNVDTPDGMVSIRTRVISEYDYGLIRLSPHIYNTIAELDVVVGAIDRIARTG